MVSGPAGQSGRNVLEHAASERRDVPEHAQTLDQQMEAKIVRELQMKLENAAIEFAQVSDSSSSLLLSQEHGRRTRNKI